MNLLMISSLEAKAYTLAELLAAKHQIHVMHTTHITLDCPFTEQVIDPVEPVAFDLAGISCAICCCSPALPTSVLTQLLEQARPYPDIRIICLLEHTSYTTEIAPGITEKYLCHAFEADFKGRLCYIEIPAIYGEDFLPPALMSEVIKRPRRHELLLHGHEHDLCDLLHVADLCDLMEKLISANNLPATLRISGGRIDTLAALGKQLHQALQLTEIQYTSSQKTTSESVPHDIVDGWMPQHSFFADLSPLINRLENEGMADIRFHRGEILKKAGRVLLFVILYTCVCLYTGFFQISSELQFVDVRLLFVVFSSLFWGKGYGLTAAFLCCAASVLQSMTAGISWHVIFFHVDNWIPLAVYLAAALLLGMYSGSRQTTKR